MTPRQAGILGMIVSLAIAVIAGALISHSLTAILGALLLVVASIGFAISTTWLYRKSWEKNSWPTVDLSLARQIRGLRRVAIYQSVLTPLLVGGAVWEATQGNFGLLPLAALAIFHLYWVIRIYRIAVARAGADVQRT